MKALTFEMKLSYFIAIAVALGCRCAFAGDYENGAAHVQAGNVSKALGPLDNAATKGDVRAQALLASLYLNGNGVPKDAKLAATWYQRAASQGYALAQLGLGTLYLRGEGVTQDYEVGFRLVRLAAEGGLASAQRRLGLLYGTGTGVQLDYKEEIYWLEKAAAQGDAESQYGIGLMYRDGADGAAKDEAKAVSLFRLAAAGGQVEALYTLGIAYLRGRGVPQDFVEAHKWFNLSAATGDANAVKARDITAGLMTREQIAEAQRLAREWSGGARR